MSLVLIADIFGKTPALIKLADALNTKDIIDPYAGKNMNFADEAMAYAYFIEHVGLDGYLELVRNKLAAIKYKVPEYESLEGEEDKYKLTLIGFSVGASVIWRLSAMKLVCLIKQGIGFYGSQIRNYTDINPQFSIELIFPKSEAYFDVITLQKYLNEKHRVVTTQVEYLHGFMNENSINYHHKGYLEQLSKLSLSI